MNGYSKGENWNKNWIHMGENGIQIRKELEHVIYPLTFWTGPISLKPFCLLSYAGQDSGPAFYIAQLIAKVALFVWSQPHTFGWLVARRHLLPPKFLPHSHWRRSFCLSRVTTTFSHKNLQLSAPKNLTKGCPDKIVPFILNGLARALRQNININSFSLREYHYHITHFRCFKLDKIDAGKRVTRVYLK